jgi:hypothetical protein
MRNTAKAPKPGVTTVITFGNSPRIPQPNVGPDNCQNDDADHVIFPKRSRQRRRPSEFSGVAGARRDGGGESQQRSPMQAAGQQAHQGGHRR